MSRSETLSMAIATMSVPNLRSSIGNLRGTGLPWWQVLAQVANNFRIKVVTRRNCCGNIGQPGC